ncbi:MAG: CopG family ribbon-helix-helix protein [Nitrospirales bacterium]
MSQETGNVTVRMPVKTQKKLEQIASGFERSRNWLINEAIENYLDVHTWQEERIRQRLKKADKDGKFHTRSQVSDLVESFKP